MYIVLIFLLYLYCSSMDLSELWRLERAETEAAE